MYDGKIGKYFSEEYTLDDSKFFWEKIFPTFYSGASTHYVTHLAKHAGPPKINFTDSPTPGDINLVTKDAVSRIKGDDRGYGFTEIRPKFKRDIPILSALEKIEVEFNGQIIDIARKEPEVLSLQLSVDSLLSFDLPKTAITHSWNKYGPTDDIPHHDILVRWVMIFRAMIQLKSNTDKNSFPYRIGTDTERSLQTLFGNRYDKFLQFVNMPVAWNAAIKKDVTSQTSNAGQSSNRSTYLPFHSPLPYVYANPIDLKLFIDPTAPKRGANIPETSI